ncbi:hypothetical protein K469DRAFT_704590, partial [Zopfia rhizophila CBS 207.26]
IQLLSASTAPRTCLPDLPRFDGKPFTLYQLTGADVFDYRLDCRSRRPQLAQKLTQKTAHESMDVDHLICIASARVSFPHCPVSLALSYPVLPHQPRIKTTARSPTLDALLAARREEESNVTG